MGKRSDRRKFRRRRRWAGFFLLLSLAFLAFGAILISDVPSPVLQAAASGSVDKASVTRVASVRVADAPEAAGGQENKSEFLASEEEDLKTEVEKNEVDQMADEKEAAGDQGSKSAQESDSKSSGIPTPPTNDLWMSIAAHRLGWPGTASYHQFYDLPLLAKGDVIYLGDANGTTYTYRVTGFREITPDETWITAPKPGRDMVSLQTCIENFGDYWTMGPNWYVRYIVQADRVSVDVAR